MVDTQVIAHWIERARAAPVRPWLDYAFEAVPFAIYDDDDVVYINHPNPPAERPDKLMAATAVEIGGVQTATLPTWVCEDEVRAVTIAYHEGFHVYQAHSFSPTPADMFTAMAHYPELVPEYRTLCRIEARVLNDETQTPADTLHTLSAILRLRRDHYITDAGELLAYERYLERFEGTASYVEQAARQALFGIKPDPVTPEFGWSRFYQAGAALCRLLDTTHADWKQRVKASESLADIVVGSGAGDIDLSEFGWSEILEQERAAVTLLKHDLQALIQPLEDNGLIIEYPAGSPIYRAFSPNSMQPLGDGRIMHRQMFKLMLPGKGHASAEGTVAIDDITNHRIILPARPVSFDGHHLQVEEDGVEISLTSVTQTRQGTYAVTA